MGCVTICWTMIFVGIYAVLIGGSSAALILNEMGAQSEAIRYLAGFFLAYFSFLAFGCLYCAIRPMKYEDRPRCLCYKR